MRYVFVLTIAAALVLAGCSSNRSSRSVAGPSVRTQTVTARPVARTVDLPVAQFAPPPAPPIPEHTTLAVPARRTGAETAVMTPASRPARSKAVPTSAQTDPCDPCCPGGVCGIPDPCCPGGVCGIPQPAFCFDVDKKK